MGKEIKTTPEAIRDAGHNISGIELQSFYAKFTSALASSDGLTAEGVNEIIEELTRIEELMNAVLKKFPRKLEDVAKIIEESDNAAASQFK